MEHSFHQYTVLLDLDKFDCTRDDFINDIKVAGVGVAVHYPRPIHQQPAFEELCGTISLPVSEDMAKRVFSLPVHPGLSLDDLESIANVVKITAENRRR